MDGKNYLRKGKRYIQADPKIGKNYRVSMFYHVLKYVLKCTNMGHQPEERLLTERVIFFF